MSFNKQRFSELLAMAKGSRSINKYGRDTKVDPGYISRLLRCLIDKAPSADVILRLTEKSYNGVTAQELMKAAGYLDNDTQAINTKTGLNKNPDIDYMFQAQTLADALLRLAELDIEYNFDDDTMFRLVKKAREKYGLPDAKGSDLAAHGPKFPGSGVFNIKTPRKGDDTKDDKQR
jgi:hypothetical protein